MMSAWSSAYSVTSSSPRRARQLEASFLIGENFRVHERHIEELALLLRHLAVEAALESAIGDGAGDRIGSKVRAQSAEHVARKLIEHDG